MPVLGMVLQYAGGIGFLICFILVLIQMFQRGQATLGIVCAVLALCGIGFLIAFVYGWVKHREWGITNIMIAWTCCWIVSIIGGAIIYSTTQVIVVQPQVPVR